MRNYMSVNPTSVSGKLEEMVTVVRSQPCIRLPWGWCLLTSISDMKVGLNSRGSAPPEMNQESFPGWWETHWQLELTQREVKKNFFYLPLFCFWVMFPHHRIFHTPFWHSRECHWWWGQDYKDNTVNGAVLNNRVTTMQ